MISNLARRLIVAAFLPVSFALAACAGPGSSTVPGAGAFAAPQAVQGPQLSVLGAQPDTTCPKQYLKCYTFSLSKGLRINWCYGPTSNPCSQTNTLKWSGGVCSSTNKFCYPPHPFLKSFIVKWSGPYNCKTTCKGQYEVDKITKGIPPPKKTTTYAYKQDIHGCPKTGGKCLDGHIGLAVGP